MLAMDIMRVVPNITSSHFDESRNFYVDFLGFKVVMDMGFIVTLVSPSNPKAHISIVRGEDALPAQKNITLSIEVGDVVQMHQRVLDHGLKILYPLTVEPWGVRRFWVADPDGTVLNIMSHVAPQGEPEIS
jgi:catechol 2,3-dioxygenase-like lactoylglutathione lyase family enzyme